MTGLRPLKSRLIEGTFHRTAEERRGDRWTSPSPGPALLEPVGVRRDSGSPGGRDGFGAYYYLEVPARARRPARRSRMRGHEIPKGDPQVKGKMSACGLGSTRGRR